MMEYAYAGNTLTSTSVNNVVANVDYQHTWAGLPQRSLVVSYQFSGAPSGNLITSAPRSVARIYPSAPFALPGTSFNW